jgi:hypothetical protein
MENTNAIRIGDGEGGRGQIIRDIQPNTSYTLSGWGKVSEEGETGYLGVKCMDSTGKKLKAFGPAFTGTEYTYQSKTFTTPEGTAKVLVNVWKDPSAAGKSTYAYYDNISLCRDGDASQGTLITPVKPSSEVFYDDFTNGIDSAKWLIGKAQWGKDETGKEANGGVIPENVSVIPQCTLRTPSLEISVYPNSGSLVYRAWKKKLGKEEWAGLPRRSLSRRSSSISC